MKKLLSILGTFCLVSTTTTSVIACTSGYDYHNQDYNKDKIDIPAENKKVQLAMESRLKSAILTDQYGIEPEQVQNTVFNYLQSSNKTYKEYFDENSLQNNKSSNIDLKGDLGYSGGIIKLGLDQLNLSDFLKNTINNIANINLDSQEFRDFITGEMTMVGSVLKTMNLKGFLSNFPVLVTQIPDNFLKDIPDLIANTLGDVTQELIDTFAGRSVVEPVLDSLVSGTNLSRFESLPVNQVFDAFFVNLTNLLGYGSNADFQEFSDTDEVNFEDLAKYWFENLKNFQAFDFTKNLPKTVEKFMSLLGVFNILMSVYKTPQVKFVDDQHLFDDQKTNSEFVLDIQSQLVSSFNFNLTNFQLGQFVSNIVYYFNSGVNEKERFTKFMHLWLFNGDLSGDDKKLPAFWKFVFGLIKADSQSDGSKIPQAIPDKLFKLYHETLAPKFLQPILNNTQVEILTDETQDSTYWSIVKDDKPELKTLMDTISKVLTNKPMDVIYNGNLNPIVDASAGLSSPEEVAKVKEGLKKLIGDKPLNVNNLLNSKLYSVLGLANVTGFPTNEIGLIPNYAGYYTSKSLHQLVGELSKTFSFKGFETNEELLWYAIDFNALKTFVTYLLYDNKLNLGKGAIADMVDAFVHHQDISAVVGSKKDDPSKIKKDSTLGSLMVLFIPELSSIDKEYFEIDLDLKNKQDNFKWIMSAFMDILINTNAPTNYEDFINQVLDLDVTNNFEVFKIDPNFNFFSNGSIESARYSIKYNYGLVEKNIGTGSSSKIVNYELSFKKEKSSDINYKITMFRKV